MKTIYYCVYCGKQNRMEDLSHRATIGKKVQSLHCECGKSKFEVLKRVWEVVKIYVYVPDDFYEKVKKISNQEGISMSTLFKVSFVDKYAKFYPELFKIKKEDRGVKNV